MKKPIVCLSPSNQTENRYAYGNTTEAEQCQRIADAAAVAFERCGISVVMADNTLGMAKKCQISDAAWADLHWPIHTNAHGAGGGTSGGTHMYAYNTTGNGARACSAVIKHLAPITPGSSGENVVHTATNWYEITTPNAPTVYQETEFHDVPEYAKWIIEHVDDIAEAMAKGACDYFGLTYVPPGGHPDEDIGEGHDYSKAARKKAIDKGIIIGKGEKDGKTDYAWADNVTREELVTILDRMALL